MDVFSTKKILETNQELNASTDFATFGAIHLDVTNLEKTIFFWTTIVGMKLRKSSEKTAELGTDSKALVIVYEVAKKHFVKGYSGLYHFAINAPNANEFAYMINRLMVKNYPFSAVDHTMSKSIYLDDPDGINIEFTLETPERFKRVVIENGLQVEDKKGNIKSASAFLDINKVLENLKDTTINRAISNQTCIGHLHLYVTDVEKSNDFYQKLGLLSFNSLPYFMYADLGFGGAYKHRIALNSWHGANKPIAPIENAGMKYFQINFKTEDKLKKALKNVSYKVEANKFWVKDATGNKILLTTENS